MLNWLKNLARGGPPAPTRETLLNHGLELAMDWGKNGWRRSRTGCASATRN